MIVANPSSRAGATTMKAPERLRSLNNFPCEEDMELALRARACPRRSDTDTETDTFTKKLHVETTPTPELEEPCHDADWYIPNCEQSGTYISQTVENELKRLKALQSFQIIDEAVSMSTSASPSSNSPLPTEQSSTVEVGSTMNTMDHIVHLARNIAQTSMAGLTLTDLGRQCVLAQAGVEDAIPDMPRRETVCAHVIICKQESFVVPHLSKDPRFDNHVLPGSAEFYGAVPLITPEGDRIGSLCVLDKVPRPQGLTTEQTQMLIHLSKMAMNALVERRSRLHQERKLKKASRVISSTVHDLLTPLTAIELALSLLHEDQDFQDKLLQHQKESVKIASNCIGVLGRMCRAMRDQHSATCKQQVQNLTEANDTTTTTPTTTVHTNMDMHSDFSLLHSSHPNLGLTAESFRIMYGSGASDSEDEEDSATKILAAPRVPVVVKELVQSIHSAMDAIHKTIPIAIVLHASVPQTIVTDDLKVLRCALNLLEHCTSVAKSGSIQLTIKAQQCQCGKLVLAFHCENQPEGGGSSSSLPSTSDDGCCHSGKRPLNELQGLRSCSEVNLYSVAMQMEAIGGDCGIITSPDGKADNCTTTKEDSFWFRIPLEEPEIVSDASKRKLESISKSSFEVSSNNSETLVLEAQPRRRRALIIEDSLVIRKVIANALSKIGFEAVTAVNGMEGLQMLQSSLYDVVLLDFLMPVMDGLDCVQQYRDWEKTHRQWLRQYIIGMSAHASDSDVERGLRAGMDCYKPKPLTYQGLKDLVEACEIKQQNLISSTLDRVDTNPLLPSSGKIDDRSLDRSVRPRMCLIASSKRTSYDLARLAEAKGWKSLIVHDGEDALQALKKRNWDAVFLDEKLPLLSGKECIAQFRAWEKENRVNSQKNLMMLSAPPRDLSDNFTGPSTTSKVPTGADNVLHKPVPPKEFEQVLNKAEDPTLNIIMR